MKRKWILLASLVLVTGGFNSQAHAGVNPPGGATPTPAEESKVDGTAGTSSVLYWGGPVISHLKLYAIYWGTSVNPAVKHKMGGFLETLMNSTYFDFLNQEFNTKFTSENGYPGTGQAIHRGWYMGGVTIHPKNTSSLIRDDASHYEISAEIKHQIEIGVLPKQDKNTAYLVFLPPSVNVSNEFGVSSQGWCSLDGAAPQANGSYLTYSIIPDLNNPLGLANCVKYYGNGDLFATDTVIASASIAANVTDPHVPPPGTNGGQAPETWIAKDGESEIYAYCGYPSGISTLKGFFNDYSVASLYSRSKASCSVATFKETFEF